MRINIVTSLVILTCCCAPYISANTEEEFSNVELELADAAIQQANMEILQTPLRNVTLTRTLLPRTPKQSYAKFPMLAELIGRESNTNLRAYEILVKINGIPRNRALRLLRRRLNASQLCSPRTKCKRKEKYRSVDGTCNNLDYPQWGAAPTPFRRLVPAAYNDGFGEPRGGNPSIRLPNVRLVSSSLHPDLIHPDPSITNMVPQVGQFIDHDLTLTPEADRKCCTTDKGYVDCLPIVIPSNDPFYSTLTVPQNCMDFTRSTVYCFPTSTGIREQFNVLTAYLDLSQVYGSDEERAHQLRGTTGGLMRINEGNSKFLPTVAQIETLTTTQIDFKGKFLAGDERVNEMPALATMHTLWLREHNRVAQQLQQLKPYWDNERLFQETRRIVTAEWQNIVFGEWLPIVLGNASMQHYELGLGDSFSTYDPTADATIFTSFATAAFRFGHTLINGVVRLLRGLNQVGEYRVRDNFFESKQLEQNGGEGYDLILGGLMIQNAQTYDRFVTEDLTNHLLKNRTEAFGGDLIARNLHRGREHGIRPYNDYRTLCNLTSLTSSWNTRPREITPEIWAKFRALYSSPLDIDLFSGGIAETPVPGGVSGATFNCLKGRQFHATRFGDRFFFTHENQVSSFLANQLEAIRKRRLGDVICDNSNLEATPANVFRILSPENSLMPCNDPKRSLDISILLPSRA